MSIKALIENYTELLSVLITDPMTPEDIQQAYILRRVIEDLKVEQTFILKNIAEDSNVGEKN